MEKKIILITRAPTHIHENAHFMIQELAKKYEIRMGSSEEYMKRDKLLEEVKDVIAILSFGVDRIDREVIEKANNLKLITTFGAGYNTIDVDYATERGIYVCNTPDVVSESTSDIAIFLLLACCRRTSEAERYIREGNWNGGPEELERFLGINPSGKILGIIGMGGIGKLIAKKAKAFSINIIYHNRNSVDKFTEKELNCNYVTLDDLLSSSDFISINIPLNNKTKHFINKVQFDKMKEGVIIINTSRGSVIHEKDLVDALKSGKVKGAGLDVFEFEPKIEPELLQHPNVTVLPHIGTCTRETRSQMFELMLQNISKFMEGETPLTPVNNPKK
jgi:glyoxylate reductase